MDKIIPCAPESDCRCLCEACGCLLKNHFIPDSNTLVEQGIDPNNCGGMGKINICEDCGNCYV